METFKKNHSLDEEAKKNTLKEIEKIYSLKRKINGPFSPSPNVFLHKLKYRMTKYYNDLYNTKNFDMK